MTVTCDLCVTICDIMLISNSKFKKKEINKVYHLWFWQASVEEQIQWILSYVQKGSADVWKENLLEDLELEKVGFGSAEKFLLKLKKEFSRGDKESVKVAEIKKIE